MAVVEVKSKEEFDKIVSEASKPVFVDYFADWCGKCSMLAPEYEEIAEQNKDTAVFIKVDAEELQDLAMEHETEGLPTVQVFRSGAKQGSITASKLDKIKEFILDELKK